MNYDQLSLTVRVSFVALGLGFALGCAGTDGPATDGVAAAGNVDGTLEGTGGNGSSSVDPTAPDEVLFQEALALYNAGDAAGAEPKFLELVSTYPDSLRQDNSRYLAARSQYQLLRFQDCVETLDALRVAHPTTVFLAASYYFSGRAEFRLLNYAAAQPSFALVISTDPANIYADNAAYYVGRCDFELGNLVEAETTLAGFEQSYSDSSYLDNALFYLGRTRFAAKAYADAAIPLGRVIALVDSNFVDNALYFRGRSYEAEGQSALAQADYERIVTDFAAGVYADNSLYHLVRLAVGAADCATAAARRADLVASFPLSAYLTPADDAIAAGGC